MPNKEDMELLRRHIPWDPVPPWIIHWDPIPPWLNVNDEMLRQFAQMELKFRKMELDIMQQKLKELEKIVASRPV